MCYISDLHTHSTASDGQYTPTKLVDMAKGRDLEVLALTDHDTVEYYCQHKKTRRFEDPSEPFQFVRQSLSFEAVEDKTFTDVLYSNGIYGVIHFHLRECVKRETRLRAYPPAPAGHPSCPGSAPGRWSGLEWWAFSGG